MDKFEKIIINITEKIKNNNVLFLTLFILIVTAVFLVSFFSAADDVKFIYGGF